MPTDRHARWMRYQAPPNSRFDLLCYSSSVRGISSETMDTSLAYWGALLSTSHRDTDIEASASSYQDELADLAAQLPPRTTLLPHGVAERYTFWDVLTQVPAVLWRLPTHTVQTDAAAVLTVPPEPGANSIVAWSATQRVTQAVIGQPIVYWGRTSRVPRSVMEQRIPGSMRPYEIDPDNLAGDAERQGVVVVKGALERYEVWEVTSGDLLILWRFPCRPTG